MAPHHHHHSRHHGNNLCQQTLNSPYSCASCCCSCSCNSRSLYPTLHPPPISTEQLLQAMATNLIKNQSFIKPQQLHSQSLIQDLIRRVSALESSLSPLSSCAPPTPSVHPSPSFRKTSSSLTLREVAARTIQERFRRFLVRRSQTLRDLKRLASIKSSAAALRSSISGDPDADHPVAISQEAMDLLLKLDSIQSSDPMIRDGKRSISRELTRMLEFVDMVLVRERRLSHRAMDVMKDAAASVPRTRSAKRVSFADNRRGIEEEAKERFSRDLEENEGVFENGSCAIHGKNGGFELSAPQPIQMEQRFGC